MSIWGVFHLIDARPKLMDEYYEEVRFYCDACGHNFCLELEEDMPLPKFCLFCSARIYFKDDEDYKDDKGFHL